MRMSVIIFIMVYCSCYRGQWPREMREIPRVRDFPRLGELLEATRSRTGAAERCSHPQALTS